MSCTSILASYSSVTTLLNIIAATMALARMTRIAMELRLAAPLVADIISLELVVALPIEFVVALPVEFIMAVDLV